MKWGDWQAAEKRPSAVRQVLRQNLHSFLLKIAQTEVNDFDLFDFFLCNSYP